MRKIYFLIVCLLSIFGFAQDGALDLDFNSGVGFNGSVREILLQPDGKIVVFGFFDTYDNVPRDMIARINSDGSLDAGFNFYSNFNYISDILLQPDGKIIYSEWDGVNFEGKIRRLNSNGSVDQTFNIGNSAGSISSLGLQSDGKIIISGGVVSFNGHSIINLARLNSNGSFDPTFSSEVEANFFNASTSGHAILIQPDNKIIINTKKLGVVKLARLNPNGSLDLSFNAPEETYASKFLLQPDGKIVFSREIDFAFPIVNSLYQISRLNANGSHDVTFGSTFLDDMEYNINSIALQSDGKILIGGDFNSYTSNPKMLARLNANGTLDTSFQTGTGPNHRVDAIVFKPNGKVVIGGHFTEYNGVPKNYVAQIIGVSRLAVNPFEEKQFAFYPNPVKDILHLSLPEENSIGEYEIYDLVSKRIVTNSLNENQINVSNLAEGIYILKIKTDNGVFTSNFVKE